MPSKTFNEERPFKFDWPRIYPTNKSIKKCFLWVFKSFETLFIIDSPFFFPDKFMIHDVAIWYDHKNDRTYHENKPGISTKK